MERNTRQRGFCCSTWGENADGALGRGMGFLTILHYGPDVGHLQLHAHHAR